MNTYAIPMIPGPVRVPPEILQAMMVDFGSGDLEREFLDLYNRTEANLQTIYGTKNAVAIMTGEGMLALWSGLKSVLLPGDRVLAVGTGVFGYGIGDMARAVGAEVKTVGLHYDETLGDLTVIEEEIKSFRPKMITAVHCETPSGTLNPLAGLGMLKQKYEVPLFYVDAVASAGGTAVLSDEWSIDLSLGASQKALSAPPLAAFLSVSPRAWEIAEQVDYAGYDALLPYRDAQKYFYFPYTPHWHGLAALYAATQMLLDEGLENAFARHAQAAEVCRSRIEKMGLRLFPAPEAISSPTVTAVYIPEGTTWEEFDQRLREHGLAVGNSYGPLAGKIFRIGHMGSQADLILVNQALDIIETVIHDLR
ncbi:MAG: pyridoxal-phosphate-dependent aminotransferase family protein [Bellilinea sp.]